MVVNRVRTIPSMSTIPDTRSDVIVFFIPASVALEARLSDGLTRFAVELQPAATLPAPIVRNGKSNLRERAEHR